MTLISLWQMEADGTGHITEDGVIEFWRSSTGNWDGKVDMGAPLWRMVGKQRSLIQKELLVPDCSIPSYMNERYSSSGQQYGGRTRLAVHAVQGDWQEVS